MQFANLRLGKTQSGRKCAYYFALHVYSDFEYVQRLVVWKRDSRVGLWVSVQNKCGNAATHQNRNTIVKHRPRQHCEQGLLEILTKGHDHTRNDTMLAALGYTVCLALVRLLSQQRFRLSAVFDFSRKTLTISQILKSHLCEFLFISSASRPPNSYLGRTLSTSQTITRVARKLSLYK